MKRLLPLALLILIPGAAAESDPPDQYTTHNVNVVGIIPAGSQNWWLYYPTEIDDLGVYQLSVTVDSSAAASTTLTLNAMATVTTGCTVGAIVITHSTSSNVAARIPITVTEDSCHASIGFVFETAAGTDLSGIQAGFQIQMHDLEIQQETFDFWLPVLIFMAIFLWGGYTRQLVVMLAGTIGILVIHTGNVPFGPTFALLLALLAAAILAIKQSWSRTEANEERA